MRDLIGIGVDIEFIDRFDKLDYTKNSQFLTKIFTNNELSYCFAKKSPGAHLAVRFAAKEAIIKAFSSLNKKIFYKEIEVIKNKNGSPNINILKHSWKNYVIKVSLSHSSKQAIAFIIILKDQDG